MERAQGSGRHPQKGPTALASTVSPRDEVHNPSRIPVLISLVQGQSAELHVVAACSESPSRVVRGAQGRLQPASLCIAQAASGGHCRLFQEALGGRECANHTAAEDSRRRVARCRLQPLRQQYWSSGPQRRETQSTENH